MTNKCPRCGSTAPHMHPAVQYEGEVETCPHEFHLTPTPQNKPEYIALVEAKRRSQAQPTAPGAQGRVVQPKNVAELDALLNSEDDRPITIHSDGSISDAAISNTGGSDAGK